MKISKIFNILRKSDKKNNMQQNFSDFGIKWIFVEITNVCNMHCKFCPSDHIKRERKFMDFDLFKKIIDQISDLTPPHPIALHVIGEPLLHKNVFDYIDYCNQKKIKIYLFTNCTRINENIVEICKKDNIDALVLSVQTPTQHSYELRGFTKSFEDYMNGIYSSIEYIIKTKTYSKMRVELHIANTKHLPYKNWSVLDTDEDAINIITDISRKIRRIYYKYQNNNHDQKTIDNFVESDLNKIPENILDLREWDFWGHETTPNIFIRLKYLATFGSPESIIPEDIEIIERTAPAQCNMTKENLSILSDGTITTCCFDVDGELTLGNINNIALYDALKSNIRTEYLQNVTNNRFCRKCLGELKTSAGKFAPWIEGFKELK